MKKIIIAAIIMAFSGFSFAAETLKLNTKGKQYCVDAPPLSFNSKTDIDLWLSVDNSLTTATIYADESLLVSLAVINLRTAVVSTKKISFNGFSGNSSNHISVAGTFGLDSDGYVKTVKATMIRRGVLNSCYSNAVVSGKRVI